MRANWVASSRGDAKQMNRCQLLRAAVAVAVLIPGSYLSGAPETPQRAFLDRYCITCHNQRAKTAGLMFDKLDVGNTGADARIWEEAVRKLRAA